MTLASYEVITAKELIELLFWLCYDDVRMCQLSFYRFSGDVSGVIGVCSSSDDLSGEYCMFFIVVSFPSEMH